MDVSKLAIFLLPLALVLVPILADTCVPDREGSLTNKLDQLKSKIRLLESQVEKKTRELADRDNLLLEKDKVIREKSGSIASLEAELSLQWKGGWDAEESMRKANARCAELEKAIARQRSELEEKEREKKALEAQLKKAGAKLGELNLKVEKLEKLNEEQRSQISKTERALKVAEEELVKAKFEASSKTNELMQVHNAWFPPWLAARLFHYQALVGTYCKVHGRPAWDFAIQKALEAKGQARNWAEPHVETLKSKLVPAMKDQWVTIRTYTESHVHMPTAKALEVYESSKATITPYVIKLQETVDPYFQEAKKFSKPYIDHAAVIVKPHAEKARMFAKPYVQQLALANEKFSETASTYHYRVQGTVQEWLKKHELTRPLAIKELEWFAASIILALPVIMIFRLFSAIFCKKPKKHARHGRSSHSRHKAKREHPDN